LAHLEPRTLAAPPFVLSSSKDRAEPVEALLVHPGTSRPQCERFSGCTAPQAAQEPPSPFFIVLNQSSGRDDAGAVRATVQRVLSQAGREHHVVQLARGDDIAAAMRTAAAQAQAQRGTLVVAGGDGTVNAAAQAAHAAGCVLGVLPQGTFNYFSRTHGIPSDIEAAARLLLTATPRPVQVGLVNDRLFLVNASLGLYPQALEDREGYKRQFGRSRGVALASALATLLREHRQLVLSIERGGRTRTVRTPTLFVGNNRLQLEQVGIAQAPALDAGHIAAIMLRPAGTLALLWLMLRGAFGTLGDAERVISFEFQRMTVRPALPFGRRGVKVAADGELLWLRSPLEFRVSPRPLWLLKPDDGAGRG
jgi:diacylglycerol kinase family enzyme